MMNKEIKMAAAGADVKLWEIADAVGLSDSNFSRKLRHELSEEEKQHILAIIEEIKNRRVSQ